MDYHRISINYPKREPFARVTRCTQYVSTTRQNRHFEPKIHTVNSPEYWNVGVNLPPNNTVSILICSGSSGLLKYIPVTLWTFLIPWYSDQQCSTIVASARWNSCSESWTGNSEHVTLATVSTPITVNCTHVSVHSVRKSILVLSCRENKPKLGLWALWAINWQGRSILSTWDFCPLSDVSLLVCPSQGNAHLLAKLCCRPHRWILNPERWSGNVLPRKILVF